MNLVQSGANFKVEVSGYDLMQFGEQLIKRAMEEQAILDAARLENESKFSADGETWLTSSEAAKMCNVCVTTLWAWKKAGFLVPAKVGRSNRYALSDIKKLMASHGTDQKQGKARIPAYEQGSARTGSSGCKCRALADLSPRSSMVYTISERCQVVKI